MRLEMILMGTFEGKVAMGDIREDITRYAVDALASRRYVAGPGRVDITEPAEGKVEFTTGTWPDFFRGRERGKTRSTDWGFRGRDIQEAGINCSSF
jgi:hypothetical protein